MWARLVALVSRLRFIAARGRLSDELADELESHVELLAARYVRSGMTPEQARRAARRQVGNLTLLGEDVYRMNSIGWLEALVHDIRYAFRTLVRNPGFSAVAILTLALGIGANTAIFSVVYSVLLKPLPYSQPDELYSVEIVIPERQAQIPSLPATVQAYLEWRRRPTAFAATSALRPWECNLTGEAEPERVGGARVSANFFSFLGVPIARGRSFSAEEEQPGRERVVVISDGLWRRRYGADPTLVGKAILINGERHLVVGIAPPSMLVPTGTLLHPLLPFAPQIDIWKPIAPTASELEQESWDHGVLVRLSRGASLEQGRQQLEAILHAMLRAEMPGLPITPIVRLVPMREVYAGKLRLRLLLIQAASALLLLTTCVSLANLLMARVASRANELATRIALGAGRARIVSLTLADAVLLTIVGGGSGMLLAHYGARGLASYGPDDVRLLADARVSPALLAFAIATSLITGIACGIFPAWQAYRKDTAQELQEGGRASSGGPQAGRSRRILVGVEMALATTLLASAGLLLHSFVNVMNVDRGYDIEGVLAADLSLFGQRYADTASRATFYSELGKTVRAFPGVLAAGAISDLPAVASSGGASRTIFAPTDTDFQHAVMSRPVAMIRGVTDGYFAASGTPLRAGRFLTGHETADVAVISESVAARLWPREGLTAVVGRQFRQGDVTGPLITVAGVVQDARPGAVDREPPPVVYRPYLQWASDPMTLVVRTVQDPAALAPSVRGAIRTMDPNLPVLAIRTMREVVSATVAERRFQLALTSLFALVALVLGAVGLYGVVSYAVACRTREIGLRLALGAPQSDVMRWVLSQGMPPVLVGLVVGLAGATAAAGALRSLLFGIGPTDPLALGVVAVALLCTSGVACYVPARRAASLDPMTALRHE